MYHLVGFLVSAWCGPCAHWSVLYALRDMSTMLLLFLAAFLHMPEAPYAAAVQLFKNAGHTDCVMLTFMKNSSQAASQSCSTWL